MCIYVTSWSVSPTNISKRDFMFAFIGGGDFDTVSKM